MNRVKETVCQIAPHRNADAVCSLIALVMRSVTVMWVDDQSCQPQLNNIDVTFFTFLEYFLGKTTMTINARSIPDCSQRLSRASVQSRP